MGGGAMAELEWRRRRQLEEEDGVQEVLADICLNEIHAGVNHAGASTCDITPGFMHGSGHERGVRWALRGLEDEGKHSMEVMGGWVTEGEEVSS